VLAIYFIPFKEIYYFIQTSKKRIFKFPACFASATPNLGSKPALSGISRFGEKKKFKMNKI